MSVSRLTRSLSFALSAGSVPLLLALSLHGQPAPPPSVSAAKTPSQVADALDKIVQSRFQDVSGGRFGGSRLVPIVPSHANVGFYGYFQTNTPAEAALLASADAPHRPYIMALLHCAHVPGRPADQRFLADGAADPVSRPDGPSNLFPVAAPRPRLVTLIYRTFAPGPLPNDPALGDQVFEANKATMTLIQTTATDALPGLLKGEAQEKPAGGWLVVMRPVHASTDSCLSCHAGAKRGDTLGVMVYAVSRTVSKK